MTQQHEYVDTSEAKSIRHMHLFLHTILRPVAKVLLRSGIQFREITLIVKSVLVQVAMEELIATSEQATSSRIAVKTGIDRREVSKIRNTISSDEPVIQQLALDRMDRISRILNAWHTNASYRQADGQPSLLRREEGSACLIGLISPYAGDIPVASIIEEMLHIKAMEKTRRGFYRVLMRSYVPLPIQSEPCFLVHASAAISDLCRTVTKNLYRSHDDEALFQYVATDHIRESSWQAFHSMARDASMNCLVTISDWLLQEREAMRTDADTATVRVGLGAYLFQGESQ